MNNITLKDALFDHKNDYGFDPIEVLSKYDPVAFPGISIVIPYFQVGELFLATLNHLYESLKGTDFEIIVVDDGSTERKLKYILDGHFEKYSNLRVIASPTNNGRSKTRNIGLSNATKEICLFMDADILLDVDCVKNHLKLHQYAKENNLNKLITVSFFEFTNIDDARINKYPLTPDNIKLNDFRISCLYKDTWIGCEADKQFVGTEYHIVKDTNYFRNWNKMYGPWALSNMILGGFFMADRIQSVEVGGFSELFEGYGFTETPLPTKLIALKNDYVVPVVIDGCLHIGNTKEEMDQKSKDILFRQKHNLYFNKYLNLEIKFIVEKDRYVS